MNRERKKWKKEWQKEYRKQQKKNMVKYKGWGYFFVAPFMLGFIICTLIPQLMTFGNSFFENYKEGLNQIGPRFVFLKNYIEIFTPSNNGDILVFKYLGNTVLLWLIGVIPQFLFAFVLALIFTHRRIQIKGKKFFITVIYMPNMIMASAFSMLFFSLFSNIGPINQIITAFAGDGAKIDFFSRTVTVYFMIALMNFLLGVGSTTILIMSGIMSIHQSVFEAAIIDGASTFKTFLHVTLPMIKPVLLYCLITSMITGLQMFDVPQILTNGIGTPNYSSKTLVMWLNSYLGTSKNYGMSGAISVVMFIITAALGIIVYKSTIRKGEKAEWN